MWTLIPALVIGLMWLLAQVLIWRRNKRFRVGAPVQVALVTGYSDTKTLVDWDGSLDDEAKVFLDGRFKLAITFKQGLKVGVWSHDGEAAVWVGGVAVWRGPVSGDRVGALRDLIKKEVE